MSASDQHVRVSKNLQAARQSLRWFDTEITKLEKQKAAVGDEESNWQQQHQLERLQQCRELNFKHVRLLKREKLLLRQQAESAAAEAAAAAAVAATAAAAAAAEKEEDAAAGGDPATAADAAHLSRAQPRANRDGINAVMCACARLFENIIWSNQAGYSRLVDVSVQDQHKKTQ